MTLDGCTYVRIKVANSLLEIINYEQKLLYWLIARLRVLWLYSQSY